MTRARDVANVLTAASNLATDTETAAAISTHAALSDPHAGYLKESEYVAAGKNKIINGDFGVNQRAFTTTTTTGNFGFDRFRMDSGDGTVTFNALTFNPGEPSLGYTAKNYLSCTTTGQSISTAVTAVIQKIEDVRTFAGTTVTVSFWAKAATGTPKIAVEFRQIFGSGGTPSSTLNNYAGQVTIGTNWNRHSVTYTVPSITGSTIGTDNNSVLWLQLWYSSGSAFDSRTGSIGIQNNTISIWGVQVEAGSVATPFQTATGTIQGELAACHRYYFRYTAVGAAGNYMPFGMGHGVDANNARFMFQYPATTRGIPTLTFTAASTFQRSYGNVLTSINAGEAGRNSSSVDVTKTGEFTSNSAVLISAAANQTAYIEVSSEL